MLKYIEACPSLSYPLCEGKESKAIITALLIIGALGATLFGLSLSGYLPLYAVAIGSVSVAVSISGVICRILCKQPPQITNPSKQSSPFPLGTISNVSLKALGSSNKIFLHGDILLSYRADEEKPTITVWDLKESKELFSSSEIPSEPVAFVHRAGRFHVSFKEKKVLWELNKSIVEKGSNIRVDFLLKQGDRGVFGILNDDGTKTIGVSNFNNKKLIVQFKNKNFLDIKINKQELLFSYQNKIDFIDINTGCINREFKNGKSNINAILVCKHDLNKLLILGRENGSIELRNYGVPEEMYHSLKGIQSSVKALKCIGNILLSHHANGSLCFWNLEDGELVLTLPNFPILEFNENHIVFLRDKTVYTMHFSRIN